MMSIRHLLLTGFLGATISLSAQNFSFAQEQSTEPQNSQQEEVIENGAGPEKTISNDKPSTGVVNKEGQKDRPEDETAQDVTNDVVEESIDDLEIPEVSYDLEALPFPTRRMRQLLLEAAKAGDIEKLRQLIGVGENATLLSFGDVSEDPIDFLKKESGDDDGHEILAILSEVLEAGYVHLDAGTENELYVWPYFFALPLEGLNPEQKVELFRIVTYGDLQDMKEFGGYIFYRVGISPTGRWAFFVAGD